MKRDRALEVNDTPTSLKVANQIVAPMRLMLAVLGLVVCVLETWELRQVAVSPRLYLVFSLYVVYSLVLIILGATSRRFARSSYHWAHWADAAWYSCFLLINSRLYELFIFGFIFAIVVASFRWGFNSGMRLTLFSVGLYTLASLFAAAPTAHSDLDELVLGPIYLLLIGLMIAYWGGVEIQNRRRLALLHDVTSLSNPRFGVDYIVGRLMERLQGFSRAEACILVSVDRETDSYLLRTPAGHEGSEAARAQPIPAALGQQLLWLTADRPVVYVGGWRARAWLSGGWSSYSQSLPEQHGRQIAALLGARSFVAVPLSYDSSSIGYLYLLAYRHRFDVADGDFLWQVVQQVTPIIKNVRLIDRLAADAADEERRRIALDLHDSIIQPYIGLQLGLSGVRQKLLVGDAVVGDIERLIALGDEEIGDLRRYTQRLHGRGDREDSLRLALQRFAQRFSEATGIIVNLSLDKQIEVDGRLAAELFQIIAEGLNNIRRHTQSTFANASLALAEGQLVVRLTNQGDAAAPARVFMPRSISERAAALGGRTSIEHSDSNNTVVVVKIPL